MDYLKTVVLLMVLQTVFDEYLSSRQLKRLKHDSPPAGLRTYFSLLGDSSNFGASQHYLRDKLKFGQLAGVIDLAESLCIYTAIVSWALGSKDPTSGLRLLWDYAGSFDIIARRSGEIAQSLAFVVILSGLSMVTSIPASLYRTFVLEEKHGFNKTTLKTWILDLVKSQLLSAVIGLPLIAALLKIIQYAGPAFVTYTMLFVLAIQIVMIPVYPYLIAPIFNKYKPIHDFKDKPNYMEVADRVAQLAKRLNFPLGRLWVMDGSKRSSHSNAFFFGLPLLTKHIVLYDTLLDQNTPAEVEAVLAHELGHWKHNHSFMMLIMGQLVTLANLSLIRLTIFNPALYRSFSFYTGRPVIIGLLVSTALLSPLDTITSFVIHAVSRKFEFQADKFAFDLSDEKKQYAEDLKMALVRVGEKNKSVTDVDPLWSAYKHSHPTMPERIERLDHLIALSSKKR